MTVVNYVVEHGVATITLDSPENRNALSAALVGELTVALLSASTDPDARVIVLTHTGTTFCAGNDLREAATEGGPARSTQRLVTLLRTIIDAPKPVIARIDGHVRAGGVGIVGACDLAYASGIATFAFSEVRIGVTPAIITLTTLTRLTERAASRYYLTGEVFNSDVAAQIGVITESAPELDAALNALIDSFRLCAPESLTETKLLTTARVRQAFAENAEALQQLSARMFASDHGREGMAAFREKRSPSWVVPD
jgi:enoyl-CoA hydratase